MCVAFYLLSNPSCYATLPEIGSDPLRHLNGSLAKIEGDLAYLINLVDTADPSTKQKPWIREVLKDSVCDISSKYADGFNVTLNNLPLMLTQSEILGFRDGTKVMLGSVTFEKAEERIESNVDKDIFNPVFICPKRSHGFIYGLAKSVEYSQVYRNETKYFIKLTLSLTGHDQPQLAVYHGIIDLNKLGEKDEVSGNIYLDLASEGGRRLSLCLDRQVHDKKFELKKIKKAFLNLFQHKNPSGAAMLAPILKAKDHLVNCIYANPQLPQGLYTLSCQELVQDEYLVEICNINSSWKRTVQPVRTAEGYLIYLDSYFLLKFLPDFSARNSFTEMVFKHRNTEDGTDFKKWQLAAWENIETQNMVFGKTHLRQLANTLNEEFSDIFYSNIYRQLCNAWGCVKSMQEQKTSHSINSVKKTRKKIRSRRAKSAQTSIETTTTTDSSISL